jgi:hypothetical protein
VWLVDVGGDHLGDGVCVRLEEPAPFQELREVPARRRDDDTAAIDLRAAKLTDRRKQRAQRGVAPRAIGALGSHP